jgi:hypothetical protein
MDSANLEVATFLDRWQRTYEQFHNDILWELANFRDLPTNIDCIYRIYSRSDKQVGGRVLKSSAGISAKLARERKKILHLR